MSPPEHALVLCCDEKSQVQALDRTQPGLPLKKGRAATMTHDYKRNGTTTLFAALNVLDGQVIGSMGVSSGDGEKCGFAGEIFAGHHGGLLVWFPGWRKSPARWRPL